MKNLKNVLGLMAIAVFSFVAVGTVNAEEFIAKASKDGASYENYNSVNTLLTAMKAAEKTFVVTLEKNLDIDTAACASGVCDSSNKLELKANVTINLNGNNITVKTGGKGFNIAKGGALTINGEGEVTTEIASNLVEVEGGASFTTDGDVKLASTFNSVTNNTKALIAVKADSKAATKVTIGKDTEVSSTKGAGLIVYSVNGTSQGDAKNVTVNVAGTWEVDNYVLQIYGQVKKASSNNTVINVTGGSFKSNNTHAFYASGYGVWNITGGEITGADGLVVRAGDVNISGNPTITGAGTSVQAVGSSSKPVGAGIRIISDGRGPIDPSMIDVNIAGGKITSDATDGYAMVITNKADGKVTDVDNDLSKVKLAISGGEFVSADDNMAINLDMSGDYTPYKFIEDHEAMISGGKFENGIVEGIPGPNGGELEPTGLLPLLVGSDKYSVDEETGTVVVTAVNPGDPSTPGESTNPGQEPGDNEPSENPKTFDAIGSLVTMAVSSLGVIGTATKKVLR